MAQTHTESIERSINPGLLQVPPNPDATTGTPPFLALETDRVQWPGSDDSPERLRLSLQFPGLDPTWSTQSSAEKFDDGVEFLRDIGQVQHFSVSHFMAMIVSNKTVQRQAARAYNLKVGDQLLLAALALCTKILRPSRPLYDNRDVVAALEPLLFKAIPEFKWHNGEHIRGRLQYVMQLFCCALGNLDLTIDHLLPSEFSERPLDQPFLRRLFHALDDLLCALEVKHTESSRKALFGDYGDKLLSALEDLRAEHRPSTHRETMGIATAREDNLVSDKVQTADEVCQSTPESMEVIDFSNFVELSEDETDTSQQATIILGPRSSAIKRKRPVRGKRVDTQQPYKSIKLPSRQVGNGHFDATAES